MFTFRFHLVRFESHFFYLDVTEVGSVEDSDHSSPLQIFHLFYRLTLGGFLSYDFGPTISAKQFPNEAFRVYCNMLQMF